MIANAYQTLYTVILCILGLLVVLTFIRAIRGPYTTDRIVATNMISTQVIVIICVLALMLKEGYLADVGLIYAMISFLAVVVLCKVFMGVHAENEEKKRRGQEEKEHA